MDERLSSEALAQQVFSQALTSRVMAEMPDFGSGEFWIDSRFSYGNLAQFRQDFHEHFRGNMGFFEKGIVIYWRGYSQSAFRAAQQAGISYTDMVERLVEFVEKRTGNGGDPTSRS